MAIKAVLIAKHP